MMAENRLKLKELTIIGGVDMKEALWAILALSKVEKVVLITANIRLEEVVALMKMARKSAEENGGIFSIVLPRMEGTLQVTLV